MCVCIELVCGECKLNYPERLYHLHSEPCLVVGGLGIVWQQRGSSLALASHVSLLYRLSWRQHVEITRRAVCAWKSSSRRTTCWNQSLHRWGCCAYVDVAPTSLLLCVNKYLCVHKAENVTIKLSLIWSVALKLGGGTCWDRVASVVAEWHLLRQSGICWDRVPPSGFQTSGGSQGTMEEGYGGVGGSRCLACGEISKWTCYDISIGKEVCNVQKGIS